MRLIKHISIMSIILVLLYLNLTKDQTIISLKYQNKKQEVKNKELNDLILMGFGIGGAGYKEGGEITIEDLIKPVSIKNYSWRFENIKVPLRGCFVTSEFNDKRFDKNTGKVSYEKSTDFKSIEDYRVFCSLDGIVKEVCYNDIIYGNYVIIHGYGEVFGEIREIEIKYSHLERIDIKVNDIVIQDDVLGIMGNTGHCMIKDYSIKSKNKWRDITENERLLGYGKHLDFNIKINGIEVNPLSNSLKGNIL